MENRIIILLSICFFLSINSNAQYVSQETALRVAETFFQIHLSSNTKSSMQIRPLGNGAIPSLYAVSLPKRWVLVAGDKRVQPILAYSDGDCGEFPNEDTMTPTMNYMLEWYGEQIDALRSDNETKEFDARWQIYLNENAGEIRALNSVVVGPLLKRDNQSVIWKQYGNSSGDDTIRCYNKFCPPSPSGPCGPNGEYGNTVAGCVPVAIGQIMWYWQWPFARIIQGTNNFQIYNWDLIPYKLTMYSDMEEVYEVANLLHNIGVVANISYGCSGSSTNPDNIVPAFQGFSFSSSSLLEREDYSNSNWINMIKTSLNNLQPVFYLGYSRGSDSGHAFVIDGYDSDNKFHINDGGGVASFTYYSLDEQYPSNQKMVCNIEPNPVSCSPYIVPATDILGSKFLIQRRGGISMGNRTLVSGTNGVIISGDYVVLTSGFNINAGATLYIACNDIQCNSRGDSSSQNGDENAEARRTPKRHDTTNEESATQKVLRNGRLLIIRDGKTYTVTGMEIE